MYTPTHLLCEIKKESGTFIKSYAGVCVCKGEGEGGGRVRERSWLQAFNLVTTYCLQILMILMKEVILQ